MKLSNTDSVTVIVWLPSITTTQSAFLSQGHAALRLSFNQSVIYISFWPGKCREWHTHRSDLCQKDVPHFHTENMDRLISQTEDNKTQIQIPNLNVEAIVEKFSTLHDADMNASSAWSIYHNCSDVVLQLLDTGGFFEKHVISRISIKNWLFLVGLVTLISAMSVHLTDNVIYWQGTTNIYSAKSLFLPVVKKLRAVPTLYSELCQWIRPSSPLSISFMGVDALLSENPQDEFFSNLLAVGCLTFLMSAASSYICFLGVTHKSQLPFSARLKIAKTNAMKLSLLCSSIILTETALKGMMKWLGYSMPLYLFPLEAFAGWVYLPFMQSIVAICPAASFLTALALPLAAVSLPLLLQIFYDTTTTPRHVLTLANMSQQANFLEKTDESALSARNKYPLFFSYDSRKYLISSSVNMFPSITAQQGAHYAI